MNKTFDLLMKYKDENNLNNAELSRKLNVPENYIYRWKKSGIKGAYKRIIENAIR